MGRWRATVRWDIEEGVLAEVRLFTGLNFSGERLHVPIMRGRIQGGPYEIDGARIKSMGVIAPYGTRVVLVSAASPAGWQAFESLSGRPAIQVPDIDVMDAPDAVRTDPDFRSSYPHADDLGLGSGWTYGRTTVLPLKGSLRAIKVQRIG
jgi:hypothetical protein